MQKRTNDVNIINSKQFLILIPAHNEEKVIRETLKSIKNLDFPHNNFDVIVIEDNCTDNTYEIVKKAGFFCFVKDDGEPKSKTYALKWFLENFNELNRYKRIIILDADTIIEKNFLKIVSNYEDKVLQSFVNPLFDKNSITSSLSAYSEIISQKFKDNIKSKFNWPCILRGTGMVINSEIFNNYISLLKTQIEDTELSILLVRDGIKINYVPNAIINDPKPLSIQKASSQRARWLFGQYQIIKYYWKDLLKIAFSNIGNFFFVIDIVFKPKTLFYLIEVLLLLFFIFTNFSIKIFFIIFLSILIFLDILYFFIGGFFVEDKKHYYKTLLFSPIYIIIWLISVIKMMLVRGKKWLKAR
mgnify:FL=1